MKRDKYYFTKNIEKMISPVDIGNLQFLQNFSQFYPRKKQIQALEKSSKTTPFMSFVVEPYASFMCFEIVDLKQAQSLIPDGFTLAKTKIFANDEEEKYYCIIGVFNVHTSAFWGSRLEFNIIAKKESTNMLSWVIVDFDSNTLNYSTKNGLSSFTTKHFVITTDYNGDVIIEVESKNHFGVNFPIKNAKLQTLDQTLWLDGNFSVAYGKDISQNSDKTFSMIFNNLEASEAYFINPSLVKLEKNTWYENMFKPHPEKIVCFPYAQHFLSDSPGHDSNITNTTDMDKLYQELDFSKIKNYSSEDIMKIMKVSMIISSFISLILFILTIYLILKK